MNIVRTSDADVILAARIVLHGGREIERVLLVEGERRAHRGRPGGRAAHAVGHAGRASLLADAVVVPVCTVFMESNRMRGGDV